MRRTASVAGVLLWAWAVAVAAMAARGGEVPGPRVFCMSAEGLAKAKAASHGETLRPAVERLRREAAGALKAGPFSVLDNDLLPPSGDKHDYMSFGPYWWPDPSKKDGLPYVRRDGQVNPDSRAGGSDSPALSKMISTVETLALAYYFTGERAYADRAADVLRRWFIDPATKMNPNLNYGQGIPGRMTGRGTGIIDTAGLIRVVDAAGLLSGSPAWTAEDQRALRDWFTAYLQWLRTSKHGKAEGQAENNHGTWYDAQVAAYALFVGQDGLAREMIDAARQKRIAKQIEPEGRQPAELARTKPFSYSLFNLQALFTLAALGERVGVDVWHFQTPDGRGLRKALDFVAKYADPDLAWPYKDLKFERAALIPLLEQGAAAYGETYQQALAKLPPDDTARSRSRLMFAR